MDKVTWIHVRTADHLPLARSGQQSAYEDFLAGFNPNDELEDYGPDQNNMFLLVTAVEKPAVNQVIERVAPFLTTGADDLEYHGEYSAPDLWLTSWSVIEQDLGVSKELKTDQLWDARDAAIASGYVLGDPQDPTFRFPFVEDFFRMLTTRLTWMDTAIVQGDIPASAQLTFSDANNKKVSVGVETLRTHASLYGREFFIIGEKVVDGADGIATATTVAEVDAVTWSF